MWTSPGSETMACYGGKQVNVGVLYSSARTAVFPDKPRQRGWGKDYKEVGGAIVPGNRVTTEEGRA